MKFPLESVYKLYQKQIYPYSILLSENLPEGVDRQHLETYLSDEEFETVFKMKREKFNELSEWKRLALKEKVYLK